MSVTGGSLYNVPFDPWLVVEDAVRPSDMDETVEFCDISDEPELRLVDK